MPDLPQPLCTLGYPYEQLRGILGDRYDEFARWMYGQTGAVCEGREWNGVTYRPTGCGPHGSVVYAGDLRNFLEGGRVVD